MSDHTPRDESSAKAPESEPAREPDNTLTGILLLIPLGIGSWLLYWGLSSFGGPPSGCGMLGCLDLRLSTPWAIVASCGGGILVYGCIRSLMRL